MLTDKFRSVVLVVVLIVTSVHANSEEAHDIESLVKLAEHGNPEAQNVLGFCYLTGQGVPKDYKLSLNWYRKAADQGIADAQFNVGSFYFNGTGIARDEAE